MNKTVAVIPNAAGFITLMSIHLFNDRVLSEK
jgi:hypothetical protein